MEAVFREGTLYIVGLHPRIIDDDPSESDDIQFNIMHIPSQFLPFDQNTSVASECRVSCLGTMLKHDGDQLGLKLDGSDQGDVYAQIQISPATGLMNVTCKLGERKGFSSFWHLPIHPPTSPLEPLATECFEEAVIDDPDVHGTPRITGIHVKARHFEFGADDWQRIEMVRLMQDGQLANVAFDIPDPDDVLEYRGPVIVDEAANLLLFFSFDLEYQPRVHRCSLL